MPARALRARYRCLDPRYPLHSRATSDPRRAARQRRPVRCLRLLQSRSERTEEHVRVGTPARQSNWIGRAFRATGIIAQLYSRVDTDLGFTLCGANRASFAPLSLL